MRNSPPRAYLLRTKPKRDRRRRAAQCAAPAADNGPFRRAAGGGGGKIRSPLGLPRRCCACQEVTLIRLAYRPATFPLTGGRLSGGQRPPLKRNTNRERWLGKARRSPGTTAILNFANPGPSGPGKSRTATQILRAGNDTMTTNSASPVKGVRGKANVGTKCPP